MDDSYSRSCLKEKLKLEHMLLEQLSPMNGIPTNLTKFNKYVKTHFNNKMYTNPIIKSVWQKLKNSQKIKNGVIETIEVSSDENENHQNVEVVELIDFDVPSEGPEIRLIEVSPQSLKTNSKREKKIKKKSMSPEKNKLQKQEELKDNDLLKKFRKQIIMEELLKRDQEMLKVYNSRGKVEEAVNIEMKYAKLIQKERVDSIAKEMLKKHKYIEGELLGDFDMNSISLVGSIIPSESVITETLPCAELFSDVRLTEASDDMDFIYNPDNTINGVIENSNHELSNTKSCSLGQRRSYPLTNTKKVAPKRKKKLSKKDKLECEVLRQEIFLDKLIELAIPEVVEKRNEFLKLQSYS